MRFQVPQFIDVEDKVFGPFTFKQFVYLAGGAGLSFVLLRIFPRIIAVIFIIPVAALSLSLAFYKVNNKPFIQLVEAFFKYLASARLYIWRQSEKTASEKSVGAQNYLRLGLPGNTSSKLKDLSWLLDAKKNEESEK